MSDRRKPHKGRDLSGRFRVKQVDVEELQTEPGGVDFIKDDVRLGGSVADTGPHAGERGVRIGELVKMSRVKKKKRRAKESR